MGSKCWGSNPEGELKPSSWERSKPANSITRKPGFLVAMDQLLVWLEVNPQTLSESLGWLIVGSTPALSQCPAMAHLSGSGISL